MNILLNFFIQQRRRGLKQGRRVFSIERASDAPNVSLGWWSLGSQVGTSFADSPAFAGFPNTADMTELWFRLVRVGAPDLARRPLGSAFEPLAVGEGAQSYFLYLGQTKIGKASLLASYALDLTQNTPEATALLNSLLDYVASDRFAPQTNSSNLTVAEFDVPKGVVWGFEEFIDEGNEQDFWLSLYEPSIFEAFCKQMSAEARLTWTSATKGEGNGDTTSFAFVGGLGYWSQPKTDGYQMTIDGKTTIKFDLPEKAETAVGDKIEWKSEDGSAILTFDVQRKETPGPDFFGVFTLTIPTARLDSKAERATFEVKSLGTGSLRWFIVNEYPGLRKTVKL